MAVIKPQTSSRSGTFAGQRGQIESLQSRKQHYVNRLLNIGEQA